MSSLMGCLQLNNWQKMQVMLQKLSWFMFSVTELWSAFCTLYNFISPLKYFVDDCGLPVNTNDLLSFI